MPPAPLVIVNPVAGGGRAARLMSRLRDRLRGLPEADLVATVAPGHARELARSAATDGRDRIIAVGGDGTLQEVANGLLDGTSGPAGPSVGIIPRGSGNDLARSIGLTSRLDPAWRTAIGGRTGPLDVLRAAGDDGRMRWFVSAGGAGFDGQVAHAVAGRRAERQGKVAYLMTALTALGRYRNRTMRLTLDGESYPEQPMLLLAFTNGAYLGGGMRMCPDAVVDDGLLDLCIVGDISRLGALGQIPNLYRGTHVNHPAVEMRRARHVRIDGDPGTQIHLDGEPFGELPVSVDIGGSALRIAR